jgi:hypothetical protein
MKKLLIIPLLFINLILSATNHYVSNAGSDAANGLTIGTSWQTINKVNISTFSAGDTIFFKCGDTWRENLLVPSSGSSSHNIVFTSYGTGAKPRILGSTAITSWNQSAIGAASANNDILAESFEGTGYQTTGWSETIGANSGNIVDEDNTDVTPPAGGGSQTLKIVKVITPTGTAAASAARSLKSLTGNNAIAYMDFYVMIHAHGLASDNDLVTLFTALNNTGDANSYLCLRNVSGNIKFYPELYTGNTFIVGTYPTSGSITLDQWYHIQIKYDVTNMAYSFYIDNNSVLSGSTITGTPISNTHYLNVGDNSYVKTLTAYFDMVNVSSTNFYNPGVSMPANVWASTSSSITDPSTLGDGYGADIFFKETNGNSSWGRVKKSLITDLAQEYDWIGLLGHICIYSPTDPNTRYSSIESPARDEVISLNNKNYLTIDGFEVAYGGFIGIADEWPPTTLTGLIVKNNEIHHIGKRSIGYGTYLWHSNGLIQYNTIHDVGRRGSSNSVESVNVALHNVVIEHNTYYHGNHTTGVDISNSGAGTIDSLIVRYNLFYEDISEVVDNVETLNSGFIFCENNGAGSVTKLYIYENLLLNGKSRCITFGDVGGPATTYIYNNTFWGMNPNIAANSEFILVDVGSGSVIKNNIFYYNQSEATFACIGTTSAAGTVVMDHNLYYNTTITRLIIWRGTVYTVSQWAAYKLATGQDANSPTPADPLFRSALDFHLQETSPAIDHGIAITGIITDFDGHKVPYNNGTPDIGAYEWGQRYLKINGKLQSISGKLVTIKQ